MLKSNFARLAIFICLAVAVGWLLLRNQNAPADPTDQTITPSHPVESVATTVSREPEVTFAQPTDSDPNEQLLEIARLVVAHSPQAALKWARSQSDATLRERMLFAVVQAWGEADPRAAVAWAQTQNEVERQLRLEAALTGAATQPDVALQLGRELLASTDEETGDAWGATLVGALSRAGKFDAALEFLNEGPADSRAGWATVAFNLWAQSKPEDAAKAVAALADDDVHDAAFAALVSGWAMSKPEMLADYAIQLPSEKNRTLALNAAMESWSLQDPVALSDWMNSRPPGPVLDAATALMVTRTDGVERDPEIAMTWVAGITDAKLRHDSLLHVANEWAQTDAAAAERFVEKAPWIDANQREAVLNNLRVSR